MAVITRHRPTCAKATSSRRIIAREGLRPRSADRLCDPFGYRSGEVPGWELTTPERHTLSAQVTQQVLKGWEAVPIAAPLAHASEAASIRRIWTPVRVPGHWQLEDAFGLYEGLVLYRCRFTWRPPVRNETVDQEDGVCSLFDYRPVARLAFAQRLLGLLALGHVPGHAYEPRDLFAAIPQELLAVRRHHRLMCIILLNPTYRACPTRLDNNLRFLLRLVIVKSTKYEKLA